MASREVGAYAKSVAKQENQLDRSRRARPALLSGVPAPCRGGPRSPLVEFPVTGIDQHLRRSQVREFDSQIAGQPAPVGAVTGPPVQQHDRRQLSGGVRGRRESEPMAVKSRNSQPGMLFRGRSAQTTRNSPTGTSRSARADRAAADGDIELRLITRRALPPEVADTAIAAQRHHFDVPCPVIDGVA